jgi:hypothetical protein
MKPKQPKQPACPPWPKPLFTLHHSRIIIMKY